MSFGKLICALAGKHKWESSTDDIDLATTMFKRIDCERCGYSVDGVKSKTVKAQLLASASPRLRSVAGRLP